MKKVILTAMAALCASGLWAAPVSIDRAKTTATAFMKASLGRNVTVKSVVSATDTYYIINLNPGGWVVVSADDIADPVLGYSATGTLSWNNIPENMTGMLGSFSREIKFYKGAGVTRQSVAWKEISRPVSKRAKSRAGDDVEPLIPVNWNQPAPFNKYCPGSGNNKALVGCVAVATGQAMAVQRYPAQPQGQMSYGAGQYGELSINYDKEAPYDWEKIINGSTDKYDEVARFLYHVGVSVKMGYGPEGSGILTTVTGPYVSQALVNTFGYDATQVEYYSRTQFRGRDKEWEALVNNELQAGRAVVYCAVDTKNSAGHAFNIDGHDTANNYYHVNWGWGGYGNGYFALNALHDQQQGLDFDSDHRVIIGIGSPDQVLKTIQLSDLVIDEKMPAGTVVGQITVNGEALAPTYSLELLSEDVPFKLQGDLLVTTQVLAAQNDPINVTIRVNDSASKTNLRSSFAITVCPLRTIAQATSVAFDRGAGEILIKTRNGLNYTLTGKNGVALKSGNLSPVPHLTLKMSDLDEGENILTLTSGSETKTLTIKK